MFEALLASLSRPLLLEAVHDSLRLIRHRGAAAGRVAEKARGEPSPDAALTIAADVIGEIERAEGRPLDELNGEEVDKYIQILAELVRRRSKEELGYDEARGRSKLEELRQSAG